MLKLRSSWNLPAGTPLDPVEQAYFSSHVPAVRSLPGLRRHNVLSFIRDPSGAPPAWWWGEELYFEGLGQLDAAVASEAWARCWNGDFGDRIAAPRTFVFAIEEEFQPTPGLAASSETTVALSGIWQVPAGKLPAAVDPVYLEVHVPGVRALPRLRCHTVMRALYWPAGRVSRVWRSAEIRFDSLADFDAVFDTEQYDGIRHDGFNASVAGPDVDIYAVEDEWRAPD